MYKQHSPPPRTRLQGGSTPPRAYVSAVLGGARSPQREAGRELERQRALLKSDLVARRDFDRAEAAHETATAVVEATQRRLAQTERGIQQAQGGAGRRGPRARPGRAR